MITTNRTTDAIEFIYRYGPSAGSTEPPPLRSIVTRNVHNGYVYLRMDGCPLGRNECIELADWLRQQANTMKERQ